MKNIGLKTVDYGETYVNSLLSDLEELVPGNEILLINLKVLTLYVGLIEFFFPNFVLVEFRVFYGFIFMINVGSYFVVP